MPRISSFRFPALAKYPRRSFRTLLALALTMGIFLSANLLSARWEPSSLLPSSASATAKRQQIWERISASAYSLDRLPNQSYAPWDMAKLVVSSFLQVAFKHTSDEMPLNRKKLIHTYGTVAQVKLEITQDSPFTGVFQTGGEGLLRLSTAAQTGSFTPGLALKIFIDGKPSVNFHVMHSLDGQGEDTQFFENVFTNLLAEPRSPVLQAGSLAFAHALTHLAGAPENERTLPLDEAAAVTSSGREMSDFNAPFEVEFWPTSEARKHFYRGLDPEDRRNYRVALATIPAGTSLYEVRARTRDDRIYPLARLVTQSPFLASQYGDESLFFQHQRRLKKTSVR